MTPPPGVFCKDVILKKLNNDIAQGCDFKRVAGVSWFGDFVRGDFKWVAARGGTAGVHRGLIVDSGWHPNHFTEYNMKIIECQLVTE
jgi:hypothetical protein